MATSISADALKIKLEIELDNADNAKRALLDVKNTIDDVTGRSRKLADDIAMQRMAVEGKYDPNIQRDLEIEQAIKLTNKLNLSLAAQNAILDEIATKHFVATTATGPAQDQHIIDYQKAQKEEQRINNARIADQERVEREVAQILESELTNRQRYVSRIQELKDKVAAKELTPQQATVYARSARMEYEAVEAAEKKKLQAKQDALDKQEAIDLAAAAKRQKLANDETRRINLEMAKRRDAAKDAAIDATQRKAAATIAAQEVADKAANAERQRAINLMNSYSDATERAAADVAYFNSALAAGTITAEEHANALAGVDRRMRSMAGGAGNMGYVVGNVMTGLEDFTTVLSITGFGMDGFAAATRSASNNVGQAVRGLGTAASAIYAPLVSIAMVFAGFAIPAIYKWITGAEDATKANKELDRSFRALLDSLTQVNEEFRTNAKIEDNKRNIKDLLTPDDVNKALDEAKRSLADIENSMNEADNKMTAAAQAMWKQIYTSRNETDFNQLADFMGRELSGNVEAQLRDRMTAIRDQFNSDIKLLGGEEARANLARNMKLLGQELNQQLVDTGLAGKFIEEARAINGILDSNTMLPGGGAATGLGLGLADLIDDATIVDQIEAIEEEMASLDEARNAAEQEYHDKLQERKIALQQILDIQKQMAVAQAAQDALFQIYKDAQFREVALAEQQKADALEALQIQNQKNRLLGDENEAERKLLDLSLRRREIEDSGLATQAELEGMFNAELEAMAAQIQEDLAKLQEVTVQTGAASEASAYAQANKAVMDTQDDVSDRREEEMVELLRAIRDHLAGRNLINFQVQ